MPLYITGQDIKLKPFVVLLSVVLLCGCGKLPINEPQQKVSSFNGNFESGTFEGWDKNYQDEGFSALVVSDPAPRKGRYCAKFTVRPGDVAGTGNRSEVYRKHTAYWGTETYYAWSFMLPTDYQDCGGSDWEVIGQFHDLPDFVTGENYELYPPTHPPVSLVHYKGTLYLTINAPFNKECRVVGREVVKGVWHDIVLRIYWSPNWDGYIEAWYDGEHFTPFNGSDYLVHRPNMNNKAGNYLKIGLYRSEKIKSTNTVYFDEVKIGSSYDEVAP